MHGYLKRCCRLFTIDELNEIQACEKEIKKKRETIIEISSYAKRI